MKRLISSASIVQLAILVGCVSTTGIATAQDGADGNAGHILVNASDITWGPGPPSLPPGAEAVVIEGNPAEEGPFTLRIRLPADYRIAPHWHPGIEHLTVLSGTFNLGMGETMNEGAGHTLTVGGFMTMPPRTAHFAWVTEETVIQLHGIGPWNITYINEADDPRKQGQ